MTTLIRRELLDNLMTFRFAAAVFIILLLVVANTFVLIKDYDRRLESHNDAVKLHQRQLQGKKTYSEGEVRVDRPPNPLSIFNVGYDKRLGNEVRVTHEYVPSLWDSGRHGTNNPLMDMFASMDIVFIFQVILSLLAMIFAYDALAGEYERGTLRLVLSHSVRRGHILLAKYISAMLSLIVPLLISLLLSIILLTTSASISLNTDDYIRIGGIILTSIIYLSIFYLIGLLISVATRRTSTALMLSMFVWGFLVLVYPNAILAVNLQSESPKERTAPALSQIQQMWEEFERERKKHLANDPVPGESWTFNLQGAGWHMETIRNSPNKLLSYYKSFIAFESLYGDKDETNIPHAQNYFGFLCPLVISTAEKTWLIRKPALQERFVKPANVEKFLLKLSPVGLYDAATAAWAGTDLLGIRDFFQVARQYRQQMIDYYYDEKIFESRQWFLADKETADWTSLPQFSYQRVNVDANAKRALPDVCLLLMINVVLFIIIFLIFIKSEV